MPKSEDVCPKSDIINSFLKIVYNIALCHLSKQATTVFSSCSPKYKSKFSHRISARLSIIMTPSILALLPILNLLSIIKSAILATSQIGGIYSKDYKTEQNQISVSPNLAYRIYLKSKTLMLRN